MKCGLLVPKAEIRDHGEPCRYWGATFVYQPTSEPILDLAQPANEWDDPLEEYRGFTDKYYHQDAQHELIAWLNGELLPTIEEDYANGDPTSKEIREYASSDGRYWAIASPKGSNGHLFVGAWERGRMGTFACNKCDAMWSENVLRVRYCPGCLGESFEIVQETEEA